MHFTCHPTWPSAWFSAWLKALLPLGGGRGLGPCQYAIFPAQISIHKHSLLLPIFLMGCCLLDGCITDDAGMRAASMTDTLSTPLPHEPNGEVGASLTPIQPEVVPTERASGTVQVSILTRQRPTRLQLQGPRSLQLHARASLLLELDRPLPQPLRLPRGQWILKAPGDVPRRYSGALEVSARASELVIVLSAPLESYVADVVASESEPDTSAEALKALSVVVRTYALSQRGRHQEADLCDLAHCQVLRAAGPSPHVQRAAAATMATSGRVLLLEDGLMAQPLFHAACGGHTADPVQVFGGNDLTGAAAVPDADCPALEWETSITRHALEQTLLLLIQAQDMSSPKSIPVSALQLRPGIGGWITLVSIPALGMTLRGDSFTRALGARLGWGVVRSGRYSLESRGERFIIRGTGRGHGVGLCQTGAERRARRGDRLESILRHYFPRARVGSIP